MKIAALNFIFYPFSGRVSNWMKIRWLCGATQMQVGTWWCIRLLIKMDAFDWGWFNIDCTRRRWCDFGSYYKSRPEDEQKFQPSRIVILSLLLFIGLYRKNPRFFLPYQTSTEPCIQEKKWHEQWISTPDRIIVGYHPPHYSFLMLLSSTNAYSLRWRF